MNATDAPPLAAMSPPGVPEPRQRLGKYQLTGVLGEGAMGTVYRGIDPDIHRAVAVKAIRRHLFEADAQGGVSVAERFRNEAQAAGRLSHPGIVQVYEYGEEDGCAYIAMEHVAGLTLAQVLQRPNRLPEADVLSVMVQLLEALHYAHEQGVWHRDLKPNNLIITADGRLKITDFGIARIESQDLTVLHNAWLLIGSPGYIAPERYTGDKPDRRVDLFSCGVLLYNLLTGKLPFSGSDSEVMYQVLQHEPPAPSQVEGGLPTARCYDAVVAKALAKRPEDRHATALAFRDALLEVASCTVHRRLTSLTADAPPAPAPAELPARRATLPTPSAPQPVPSGPQPAASSPQSAAGAPTHWTAGLLDGIASLLADELGPVAGVLVRRRAARCADLEALARELAAEVLPARERRRFLTRVLALRPPAAAPAGMPPAGAAPPTLMVEVQPPPGGALPPACIDQAQALLAARVGPIARLLVQRALAASPQREGFLAALAELAADGDASERAQLLAALRRIG